MISVLSLVVSLCVAAPAQAQLDDILDFVEGSQGPWSDVETTTVTAYRVPNGSIILDGQVSSAEYGGFEGVFVNPGENAYILNWPADRDWDGPEDSSFTFYLAHDADYFYIGVEVNDDVVNSNEADPRRFWNDDAVEIIIDGENFRFNTNSDAGVNSVPEPFEDRNAVNLYGGHIYVNYQGVHSEQDPDGVIQRWRFAAATPWEAGEDGEIHTVGQEVDGGYVVEARFAKSLLINPDLGYELDNGYRMGFNIGLDDDDLQGPAGSGVRGQDLEIQYWWANRARPVTGGGQAWNEAMMIELAYTPEEIRAGEHLLIFDQTQGPNSDGRLTYAATGEVIFSNEGPVRVGDWMMF